MKARKKERTFRERKRELRGELNRGVVAKGRRKEKGGGTPRVGRRKIVREPGSIHQRGKAVSSKRMRKEKHSLRIREILFVMMTWNPGRFSKENRQAKKSSSTKREQNALGRHRGDGSSQSHFGEGGEEEHSV